MKPRIKGAYVICEITGHKIIGWQAVNSRMKWFYFHYDSAIKFAILSFCYWHKYSIKLGEV